MVGDAVSSLGDISSDGKFRLRLINIGGKFVYTFLKVLTPNSRNGRMLDGCYIVLCV
jgi:hypothetical protein